MITEIHAGGRSEISEPLSSDRSSSDNGSNITGTVESSVKNKSISTKNQSESTANSPISSGHHTSYSKRKAHSNNKQNKVAKTNRIIIASHPLSSNFEQLPNRPTRLPVVSGDDNSADASKFMNDRSVFSTVATPISHMETPITSSSHIQNRIPSHNHFHALDVPQQAFVNRTSNMHSDSTNAIDYTTDPFFAGSVETHIASIENDRNSIMISFPENFFGDMHHFNNQVHVTDNPLSSESSNVHANMVNADNAFNQSMAGSQFTNEFVTLHDFQMSDLPNSYALPISR